MGKTLLKRIFLLLPMRFSLSKNEKLKSKKSIEHLFLKGKSVSHFPLKLIYLKAENIEEPIHKIAFIAPKKNFRGAVQRNRIKRLLREAYRLNKHLIFNNIEGKFTFAIIYLGNEMPDYDLIDKKIVGLFKKFLKNEPHENME